GNSLHTPLRSGPKESSRSVRARLRRLACSWHYAHCHYRDAGTRVKDSASPPKPQRATEDSIRSARHATTEGRSATTPPFRGLVAGAALCIDRSRRAPTPCTRCLVL